MKILCLIIIFLLSQKSGCGGNESRKRETVDLKPSRSEKAVQNDNPPLQEYKIEYELKEISGIALSKRNSNLLYLHEDAGNKDRVYMISTTGKKRGSFDLEGKKNDDWEDIAVGPGPDPALSYLYIADIGDNAKKRKHLTVYRLAEPLVGKEDLNDDKKFKAEEIKLEYPSGQFNAETIMVDPSTRDIYLATKEKGKATIYKAPYPQSTEKTNTLQKVTTISLNLITAGGFSRGGEKVVLKNKKKIYCWKTENLPLDRVLSKPPIILPYEEEPQGEAFCFDHDSQGYYTTSELSNGKHATLSYYPGPKNDVQSK